MSLNWNANVGNLELWGGIECTRNRVGDSWFDQLERSGHDRRPEDLSRIAELGIRVLRYPFLWERAWSPNLEIQWGWSDQRIRFLAQHSLTPIAGLIHHGSGPPGLDLLNSEFAPRLAEYAGQFARRYPGVYFYTPVNEPLTTARFSALYGHWYPHRRNDLDFATCVLNQCRAIVLSMQAIRKIQPQAQLVQTEDIGMTQATPSLQYQADFENSRRWLTFDLLCGRVDRHHPIGNWLLGLGVSDSELGWFRDHSTPPEILGVNYYVTSERFLDHRCSNFPNQLSGSNKRHRYVDMETIRAQPARFAGISKVLQEAWERYRLPLAITECHLGCSREEQLRWLWQTWRSAESAREQGIDIRAITAWSLLGSFDWDSLVTVPRGHYEVGAFDIRGQQPRPTAIAKLIQVMTKRRVAETSMDHILRGHGWWQTVAANSDSATSESTGVSDQANQGAILVFGAKGTLGQGFINACRQRNLPCIGLTRGDCDVADLTTLKQVFCEYHPIAVVNATGFVDVDRAESDCRNCYVINRRGTVNLARCSRVWDVPLACFSTDLVFDGRKQHRYSESDRPNPLNYYGFTKASAEREALAVWPRTLMVRTSAFFSHYDSYNFAHSVISRAERNESVSAAGDVVISPTYVPDLVNATLDLLLDRAAGLWHLTNDGETSWFEFARAIIKSMGLDASQLQRRTHAEMSWIARRPIYSALSSQHGQILRGLDSAIEDFTKLRKEQPPSPGSRSTSMTLCGAELTGLPPVASSI